MWSSLAGSEKELEERERLALQNKVKGEKHSDIEKHSEICGGSREDNEIKTYLPGPMDDAKKLKLRFRVGDLDLPQNRKRYTSSRKEEDVATNMCPWGPTLESRTQIGG